MTSENPITEEGLEAQGGADPKITLAGKVVLRAAVESGDEERIKEFAQYPDVVHALCEEYTKEGNGQLVQLIRNRYRQLF
jgi:hypothetical protein